jgi:hypothetical protein
MRCDAQIPARLAEVGSLSQDEDFDYVLFGGGRTEQGSVCKAAGLQGDTGIEGFGSVTGPRGRCLFYRAPFEDSWGVRSKVHCLEPVSASHLWKNFDHVDFVFPQLDKERFYLVESRFAPPRLTEIALDEAWSRSEAAGQGQAAPGISGHQSGQGAGGKSSKPDFVGLPRGDHGIYQCVNQVGGKTRRSLFFVAGDIFRGERAVDVSQDVVYSFMPRAGGGVTSAIKVWGELMDEFPALDRFPDMGCAYQLSIDVKCGIRILQTSVQFHWEMRSGDTARIASPGVLRALIALDQRLLERVQRELPNWGLAAEVQGMIAESQGFADPSKARAIKKKPAQLDNPWVRYLSLPEGFVF